MRLLVLVNYHSFYIFYILQAVTLVVWIADVETFDVVNQLAVFYDSSNHLHRDRTFHYENPERITVCIEALHNRLLVPKDNTTDEKYMDFLELIDIAPSMYNTSTPLAFQSMTLRVHNPVTSDELQYARDILLQTHQPELISLLEDRCSKSKAQRIIDGKSSDSLGYIGYLDGGDTYVTTESFAVCLRATVAWIRAVNYCCNSFNHATTTTTKNSTGSYFAMACTRPPGHHATYDLQNGFCLYNFAAAAAIHALTTTTNTSCIVSKVSILDWDVHYGQGVADIVSLPQYRNSIRYVSIHQTPAFPYEGERKQTKDNVMTLPIPPDTTWTCGYSDIFEQAIRFCCTSNVWEPDLIIICAGYDALYNDELASVNLDAADYGRMVRRLCHHISETCGNSMKKPKIMLGLEGGYKINDGGYSGNLPDAIIETVNAFMTQSYV